MRILITGAAGFLGLNLLKHMGGAHPAAVIIGTDLMHSLPEHHAAFCSEASRVSYLRLDVCDAAACLEVLQIAQPTHIVHAAAVTFPDDSAASIQASFLVNLGGTKNLLYAAALAGSVQRVLLLSSSGLYDQTSDVEPCDEEHALNLSNAYARSKQQAEIHMAEYEAMGGFPIFAARVGPVYGEFEQARATRPNVGMVQKLVDCLASKRPIRVSGTDMRRDWTHATDIARALDLLLFTPNLNHRIYNVSSGVDVSARKILHLFMERGLQVTWIDDAAKADLVFKPEQNRKTLVIERLKHDTGFEPHFDIQTGIAQVISAGEQQSRNIDPKDTAAE